MDPLVELEELLEYFQTATFPQAPIVLNQYLTIVSDPAPFLRKTAKDVREYRGSDIAKFQMLVPLRELKALCEAK